MQSFARWHIWLGWAVALPLLLWTITGLFMAARPIEEVRGSALHAKPAPIEGGTLAFPRLSGPVSKVSLVDEAGLPVWVISGADGQFHRYAAASGAPLGDVDEAEARRIAIAGFAGKAALVTLRRFEAANAPLDLRRPRPSWQAGFFDGTHVYVDAESGEILALRTRWWRVYDLMWGLHIMDLQTREDTSNPLLWVFGGLAALSCLIGATLLFRRRKARP